MPYRSPHSGTIGSLIQRTGDIHARTARDIGAARAQESYERNMAWGNAANTIGQVAGNAIQSFSKHKQEEPQRRLMESKIAQEQQAIDDTNAMEAAIQQGGGDPRKVREALAGNQRALTMYQSRVDDARRRSVKDLTDGIAAEQAVMGQGARRLTGVLSRYAAEQESWQDMPMAPGGAPWEMVSEAAREYEESVAPQITRMLETIDPEMAAAFPKQFDVNALTAWREAGQTAEDRNAQRLLAATEASLAINAKRESREAMTYYEGMLKDWARTVDDQAGWDEMRAYARSIDAPDALLDRLGEEYSAKAVERFVGKEEPRTLNEAIMAAARAGDTVSLKKWLELDAVLAANRRAPASERGLSPEDRSALTSVVLDNPHVWRDLTQTDRGEIAVDLHRQGFQFPKSTGDTLRLAEQARSRAVVALERAKNNRVTGMTDEQYRNERRIIEDSFRVQLGEDRLTDQEFESVLNGQPIREGRKMPEGWHPPMGRPNAAPGSRTPPPPNAAAAPVPPATPARSQGQEAGPTIAQGPDGSFYVTYQNKTYQYATREKALEYLKDMGFTVSESRQ